MECPKGQIKRISYEYKRKNSKKNIKVKSSCIIDRGKPGKCPKYITMPPQDFGLLTKYNYELKDKHIDRIKTLKRAMKHENGLKVLRHLNAIRTLQKSNEKNFNKLNKDVEWLKKYYEEHK
jgi:hypothetical protein